MKKCEPPQATLLRLIVAAGLNTGAMLLVSSIFRFEPQTFRLLVLAAVVTLSLWLLGIALPAIPTLVRILLLAGLAAALIFIWRSGLYEGLAEIAREYVSFIANYNLYAPKPTDFGVSVTHWITAAASGFICQRFVVYRANGLVVPLLYLTLLSIPFPLVEPTQYSASVTLIFAALLMFLMLRAYLLSRETTHGESVKPGAYLKIGVPVCAVILVLSSMLPVPQNTIEVGIPDAVYNFFEDNFDYGIFPSRPLSVLNSAESVHLGGANNTSDTLLFSVRANSPVYLYSGVYDTYTGTSWEKNAPGISMDGTVRSWLRMQPYRRFEFDAEDYPGALPAIMRHRELVGEPASISVLYHRISTEVVFLPRYCDDFTLLSEGSLSTDGNGIVYVTPNAGREFSYQAWFVTPDYAAIGKLSEQEDPETMWEMAEFFKTLALSAETAPDFMADYLPYLELPDTVSERTRQLADSLKEPGDTLYEYVLRVQNHLAAGYSYNLNVPPLPEGADFVDNFLFETKQGYCTSYASSMVVMLRSMGIMARYCQGFALSPSRYEDGVYAVTGQEAHAWVEAYIPNLGWLSFDPTAAGPGTYFRNLQNTAMPAQPTPAPESEPDSPPSPSPTPEASGPGEQSTPTPAAPAVPDNKRTPFPAPVWIALLLPAALVLLLLYRVVCRRTYVLHIRIVRRMPPAKRSGFWFGRILRLLEADGIKMRGDETLGEFMGRVRAARPQGCESLEPVIDLMQRVYYSNSLLQPDEVYFMERAYRQMASGISANWSKRKLFRERYITGRMLF